MDNEIHIINNREIIRKILEKGRYTTLALSDGNDPYVLTMHYGLHESDDILYFQCYGSGSKMDFFRSNPYVSGTVIVEESSDDSGRTLSSVVYSGLLEVLHRQEEKDEALSRIRLQSPSLQHKFYTDLVNSDDRILIMKLPIEEISGKLIPQN